MGRFESCHARPAGVTTHRFAAYPNTWRRTGAERWCGAGGLWGVGWRGEIARWAEVRQMWIHGTFAF
jgi:hypothetical protein